MVTIRIHDDEIEGIDLFVFDKDGTLIDLYTYWCNMIALRASKMCACYGLDEKQHKEKLMFEMGVDTAHKKLRPEGPVGLLPRAVVQQAAEKYLVQLGCSDAGPACFRIFQEVDEESTLKLHNFIKAIPGAIELLVQIKSLNGKIAVATTDTTQRAELAMKFLKVDHLIDAVVGADNVKHSKPAPDMLYRITEILRIPAGRSVMVGDSQTDIQIGINAGFKASVAVCSGLTDKTVLSGLTKYVVNDISGIKLAS